ncbi:MAG: hypothetical protein SGJ07_17075 [Rhodospirillaceae bacterium]|nr:hypothetical protein [Rhodospirillaceae bacterium]
MNYLTLHRQVERRALFASRHDAPIVYDEATRCHVVTNPRQVLDLLRHPGLVCQDIVESVAAVTRRYDMQLPNFTYAAGIMPLLMEGPRHEAMRRRMAAFLAGRRKAIAARLSELADRHFAPLRSADEIDLAGEVLLPFVRDLFSEMVEASEIIPLRRIAITRIFDRYIGLRTIQTIDSELADLRACIARVCAPAVARGDEDMLLALLVLGRDSLLATLASSLNAILAAHVGTRLDAIVFPDFPPETGVAIAERLAGEDFEYGHTVFSTGDRVRLFLQSLNYDPSQSVQKLIFGAGPHSCLGRHMSLDVWPAVVQAMRSTPRIVSGIDCAYVDNQIFVMPERLIVRFDS